MLVILKSTAAGGRFAGRNRRRVALAAMAVFCLVAGNPAVRAQTTAPATATSATATIVEHPLIHQSSGVVVVKVDDYRAARGRLIDSLAPLGAELVDARTEVSDKGRTHGWIKVALPAARLADALSAVRAVGKVAAEKVATVDRTSEYESLAHRVEKLNEHQQRLSGILTSERRLRGSDILFVQDRLFRASVDAALLEQQHNDLERASRGSLLTVLLFEPVPTRTLDRARLNVADHFALATDRAQSIIDRSMARAVTLSAYAAVFAPLWVPLLIATALAVAVVWNRVRHLIRRHGPDLRRLPRRLAAAAKAAYDLLPERARRPLAAIGRAAAAGAQTAPSVVSPAGNSVAPVEPAVQE